MKLKVKGKAGITGKVSWKLTHPDGTFKEGVNHNLVVTEGDGYVADLIATTPAISPKMIGMSLGTGWTASTKGTLWLTTGYAANYKAFDATYPKVKGTGADAKIVEYQVTFAAGEATSNGIDEACITNVTSATDGLHPAASTILAYAQITPEINKGAADTLTILWALTILGS